MPLKVTPWKALLSGPSLKPDWLVPNLIHRGTTAILMSKAGTGKSFIAYSLAVALATGSEFLGVSLDESRVLYIEQENPAPTVQKYVEWAWKGMGSPPLEKLSANFWHLLFQLDQFQGTQTSQWSELRKVCLAFKPHLIIIDTANPVCNIQDENDNAEAARAIAALQRLLQFSDPGAALLILKHARVDHKASKVKTVRGAKAWEGIADAVLHLARVEGGRPDSEGWRQVILSSVKVRAFGLRQPLRLKVLHSPTGGKILTPLAVSSEEIEDDNEE